MKKIETDIESKKVNKNKTTVIINPLVMCPLSAHRRITALTHLIIMATKEYFPGIGKIKFEGKESKNPMAFRYYDAEKVIMGKKMKDWLKFSMAWWHTLCAEG